jgi:hypothetical protein
MHYSLERSLLILLVLYCATADSQPTAPSKPESSADSTPRTEPKTAAGDSKDKDQKDKDRPQLNEERLRLSEGYSLLYQDAGKFDLAKLILYVKFESDGFDKLIREVAEFGGELEKKLEGIAADYPGVRIDLDPLPDMEKRKRRLIGKDRVFHFFPVIGEGGREYERTVMIGLANGLNHERYMCQALAEAETDANLKKFLLDAKQGYDNLYDRAIELLDSEHFVDPYGKMRKAER